MQNDTRQGIAKLMIIIMCAMAFMTLLSIAITIGVITAQWLDPSHGWVWSVIFWACLFGSIISVTWVINKMFNLF